MKYLLSIDAGTGSIRAVVFDINGKQISISQKEWRHLEEKGVANSMNFDFKTNWELTKEVIKEATKDIAKKDIIALSATSMREGIVLYDENKQELWGVANVDARASKEVKELKEKFKDIEKEFYLKSGQTFALGALPRLLWLKKNRPSLYKKAKYISMIGDWILAKLSGYIGVDPSNAGTTGIFNLKKRAWQKDMAKKVGIKNDIFTPVFESGEVLGKVSQKASNETSLSTLTLVVSGGGDVQLGSAGLGVVKVGDAAVLGGSFWQQVVNIPKNTIPPKDMSIRVNPHVIKNQSQAEGITFFSGLVMRWFRDAFCQYEKELSAKLQVDAYEILEKKASNTPVGSNGILPIFSDDMKYGKWYHASPSFINLNIDPDICNKYTLFRALEENAAIVANINLKKIEKWTNIDIKSIIFAGGGAKGKLWPQILSDVTGKRVKIPKVTEATALGAAMSAAIGAGIFANFQEAAKAWVKLDRVYKPNMKNHKIYKKLTKKWQKVYKKQLKLVDKGLTTSMWKAPGV